jgi:hypothetical protein
MTAYYVDENARHNGDYEVHRTGCVYLLGANSRRYLGEFANCHDAVRAASQYHDQVNGCVHCANACHTP